MIAAAYTERRRREREQARIEKDAEDEIEMDFEVTDFEICREVRK